MRAQFQVLVMPFRLTPTAPEFAVLKRTDAEYWQFVAGGGEDRETPLEAASRETEEELGITSSGRIMPLDSMATVPKECFADVDKWGSDIYVIPEHCFAVEVGDSDITLSREHTEFRWVGYEEARNLLRWDSNRNALWELNERLKGKRPPNKPMSCCTAAIVGLALANRHRSTEQSLPFCRNTMEIKELRQSELNQLLELYRHLHESDDPLPPDDVVKAVWNDIQDDQNDNCFGLFEDGILVSSCVLCIIPNLTRGCKPYGVIENVVTHSDFRRRGFGKAILEHALDHAWRQGCYKVMLLTGQKNEDTYRFYESAGFDRHAKQAFLARPKPAEQAPEADAS